MIYDGFTSDKKTYEVEMPRLTHEKLEMYCNLYDLDIERYFKRDVDGTPKFSFPGTFLLSSLRKGVELLTTVDLSFPIRTLHNMEPSSQTTDPNPVFVGDKLVLKIQTMGANNFDPQRLKLACVVQMYRDEELIFKGTFDFIERK